MQPERVMRHTGVALKGHDVVAILSIVKTIKGMPDHDYAQSYLTCVWLDWRNKDKDMEPVMDGVGTFFDLYFSLRGDFDRIYSLIIDAVPPEHRADAENEAQELAEKNIRQARELGMPCEVEVGGFPMGMSKQELN